RLPVRRQALLRLSQQLINDVARVVAQMTEFPRRLPSREDLPQPAVDVFSRGIGQRIELLGIDQVAARILEEPGLKIQLAERTPARIPHAKFFKLPAEIRRPGDRA